jgi:competence protein ComEA
MMAAAVGGLALLLAVAGVLVRSAGTGPAAAPAGAALGQPLQAPAPSTVLVHVSGAVAHPGLYRLSATARAADAIAAAGGMTAAADPGRLPNLAAPVHDGRQVNVPLRRDAGAGGGLRAGRLDLNTAGVDELRALPGMPAGLPEAIVEARSLWGPFLSVSDLRTLLDVDAATVAALRGQLTVSRRTSP